MRVSCGRSALCIGSRPFPMQLHNGAKSAQFSKFAITFEPMMQFKIIQVLECLKLVEHILSVFFLVIPYCIELAAP